jgi:hypothetical protein
VLSVAKHLLVTANNEPGRLVMLSGLVILSRSEESLTVALGTVSLTPARYDKINQLIQHFTIA